MSGKEKFAYSGMHPFTVAFYLTGQIVLTMFVMHPVVIAVSLCSSIALCLTLFGSRFLREMRYFLPFYLIVALSNPLFVHNGMTPLFFLNGKPITYEATIYGLVSSGMFLSVLLWCRVWNGIMTEEKLLYLIGKKMPKIGLVLSITFRMIPRFVKKWNEIKEAQIALGAFAGKGFFTRVKNAVSLFSALTTHAMESAVTTGMAMSARGYGLKGNTTFQRYRFSKSDVLFLTINVVLLVLVIVGISLRFSDYSYYPYVMSVPLGPGSICLYALFATQSVLLLFMEIKEEVIWKLSRSKI